MSVETCETYVASWLDKNASALTGLLERLINTDSFSTDKAGVDAAGRVIQDYLKAHGVGVAVHANETYGDALIAKVGTGEKPILLMGHRDTVFPKGEAQRRSFKIADGRAYGPGVNDMKAGVAINAVLLSAFQSCFENPPPLMGLFTGDEELASPFSRPLIESFARGSSAVFNSEPARVSGNVVIGRKGGRFMLVEVFGKPAHSGVNFFDGVSAVNELAEKICAFKAVTNADTGTTLNVGLVRGGQTVNTVAPYAAAELDLRFVDPEASAVAMRQIEDIVARNSHPALTSKLIVNGEFLPLVTTPQTRALFEVYREAAASLGVTLDGEFTGSCADSGFAGAQGVPTLCGTGAVGDKSHTPDEYILIDTLLERAKVLSVAICRVFARNGVQLRAAELA
ncbi:M20 family metallopeptidase [Bradyrhizobium sp. BR13661]|jgi:glutamate carboxypeptidase|uniref:M20 family metallopeptidase n=1 Tax=Bradyrhizobium sp. BR13661 TaxID=2940622 RepID=UPI0024733B56|nr:M20 family metallopeptidase [Bradyrhizobium sp. BR13661]MDH6261726.1 glutamate carboxypeptidase [Bradyrhizobium sp. BR13661]